ncbi:vicilin-like seed storage protein At2g18540 isoform X2 [Cynoglossus semilaevis]|uniref:vicilin-like seed storage protein At2g18540 isoform X2 n=1 Tax=Cynoglossus semilaevis TaxID=244447 RepID=UPI0004962E62|nr:vicilin-like seed storage protein At2g18540 isoform X2 [Cynoglossus semilaevis]
MAPKKCTSMQRRESLQELEDVAVRDVTHTQLAQALASVDAINELQKKRREEDELKMFIEQRKQELNRLQNCIDERQVERRKSHMGYKLFVEHQKAERACVNAVEDAKRNAIERKEQIRKLKQEKAELWERKQKLDLQVRKVIVYLGFMEELAQMTEFSDVESLVGNLERQLDLRDDLLRRTAEREEEGDEQKTEEQNKLDLTQIKEAASETLIWAEMFDQRQKVVASKAAEIMNIEKMIQNFYQMAGGGSEEDPKKQLDTIKMFFEKHKEPPAEDEPELKATEEEQPIPESDQ